MGRYDLGIFIASIVPGGPADKDGRIKAGGASHRWLFSFWHEIPKNYRPLLPLTPGGRLISLDHVSLEGATFNEAAEVMQNSPEEVQLIISQPKGVWMDVHPARRTPICCSAGMNP